MPDFSRGKIYKITGGGLTYYGSTTLKYLSQRLAGHRQDKRRKLDCASVQILDYPDCQITLVESYPCANVNELRARERFWIHNNECVNKYIPGRSQQEYYQDNKQKLLGYQCEYYQKNKEKIAEKNRQKRNKLPTETISKSAESPF